MKLSGITAAILLAIALLWQGAAQSAKPEASETLVKITKKRVPMKPATFTYCQGPHTEESPHLSAEVDIFVNETVLKYRKANPEKYDYPVGSRFVKNKYEKPDSKTAHLATIMERKEMKGKVADWEFSMVSLPDHRPIAHHGRVSCVDCHERYEERGYISLTTEIALRKHLELPDLFGPVSK